MQLCYSIATTRLALPCTAYVSASGHLLAVCRAFQNSRTLAQQGAALQLLSILKQGNIADAATVAAVCGAAKKLAANEEICKELADDGAVQVTMKVRLTA